MLFPFVEKLLSFKNRYSEPCQKCHIKSVSKWQECWYIFPKTPVTSKCLKQGTRTQNRDSYTIDIS